MKRYLMPKGFVSGGIKGGIKKGDEFDTGLIFSEFSCEAAAMFTSNRLKSAHIVHDKKLLAGKIRAVYANSGNANVFTGGQGLRDIEKITSELARLTGIPAKTVLAASTGIIGKRLPVDTMLDSLPRLVKALKRKDDIFPRAIMTTDTVKKTETISVKIGGKKVTLTAAAKGSGMIKPDMATMLAFIMTDISMSRQLLKAALKDAVDNSFNRITVDGDMSPNDSVFILANGAAGNKRVVNKSGDYNKFCNALNLLCYKLAEALVLDGEGATKFAKINVIKAKSEAQAKKTAGQIANSLLFKTALFGGSVNLGRIPSCIGVTGEKINLNRIKVKINSITAISGGRIIHNPKIKSQMKKKRIEYEISLETGKKSYFILTTDISYEYVKINADYS